MLKTNVLGLYRTHISKEARPDEVSVSCEKTATSRPMSFAARRRIDRITDRDQLHPAAPLDCPRAAFSGCRLSCGHLRSRSGAAEAPDTLLLNGKVVLYDSPPPRRWRQRRHDRRHRQLGGDPGPRRTADAGHRSRRAHSHPRTDRFAYPCDSGRPDLHDGGPVDRRAHARRGARTHQAKATSPRRARGWSSPAAGPAAIRRGSTPTQAEIAAAAPDHMFSCSCSTAASCSGRRLRSPRNRARPRCPAAVTVERDPAGQPTGSLTATRAPSADSSTSCRTRFRRKSRRHTRLSSARSIASA